jgi:hypothetical protein
MSDEKPIPPSEETSKLRSWIHPNDSGGIYHAYADWYYVNWMPLTVRIRFAQIVPDPRVSPEAATWVLDERATMTLPWATAKGLAEMLTRIVVAYEKQNGEIIVPDIPSVE